MNIAVPSRFACLRIEGENSKSNGNKKKTEKSTGIKRPNSAAKKNGNNSQVPQKQKTKKNKNTVKEQQWEEWKKKDNEMVNDNFEQDLQDALLQSQLDFEANKNCPKVITLDDTSKVANLKKKKAKNTMSLNEYLQTGEQAVVVAEQAELVAEPEAQDDRFFEKMLEMTKKEVTKHKVEEGRKEREFHIDEVVGIAQYQEKLIIEQQRNHNLQKELDEARAEVASVKARNKMLCNILGQGEMRDKAEVLMELERLNNVKDELTEEVSRLYNQLEKERSNKAGTDSQTLKHKDKKHKK